MSTNQISDTEAEAVREDLREFMRSRPDLTMADLTPFTTFAECTLRSFACGNIRGGREVVNQAKEVISRARAGDILHPGGGTAIALAEDQAAPVRRVKKLRNFYETQTVKRIAEVLAYCSEHAAIGVITADFGAGKTEAVRAWRRAQGRGIETLVIEFDEFTACNKVDFIRQLAEALGIEPSKGAMAGAILFRQVCEALRKEPRLLVFDQCELPRIRIFQVIRQIWDRTHEAGVGVVLLAAPILATRMRGTRMADLGALTSRVGIWAMLNGVTRNEMAAILKQEGLADIDDDAYDLWWKMTGGSMRRLMRSLELLQTKHAGKRITERTIQGVAGHLWGMQVRPDAA